MDRTDIEKAAVRAVGNCIDGPMLTSHLSDNDRTPIWDGDIFVYTSKEKDNDHFLGRVPVQVKGKEVTKLSEKKISYSKLTRKNLENYRKDGGCIFFVAEVMVDSNTQATKSRVFYCELSVDFITDLLKKNEDVQHPTFHLFSVPKKSVFTEKVTDFANVRYKNLVVRKMEEIEGLEQRIEQLFNIVNCISKDEYKSFFPTYIKALKAMRRERKSMWNAIKNNYADLNSKLSDVVDESFLDEIKTHSNYLLSNLYNCQSKWIDKFLVWIPEIIKNITKKDSNIISNDDLYHLIFNYAKYLLNQNKYHLIGNYFDKALRIAKKTSSPDSQWRVAETHFAKAEFLRKLNRFNEAIKEYEKAQKIYLKELKKYADSKENIEGIKLVPVINCTCNQAFLYDKLNFSTEAVVLYETLLNCFRALANDAPSYYNWFLFRTLVDFGSFYKVQNQLNEKNAVFKEAHKIYELLLHNATVPDDESEAAFYEHLGMFHQELNCNQEAETEYNEALKIYKNLAKVNRDTYINEEAKIHKRLADFYSKFDDKIADAEDKYNEALNIYEELAETNPNAYMWDLALILIDLANLHMAQKLHDKAEPEYYKALEIFKVILKSFEKDDKKTKKDAKKNIEEYDLYAYIGDVADLHYNLGRLHADSGDYLKAETELNYAYESHKILATVNPTKYNARVAGDLITLQKLFGNRLTDAQQALEGFNVFIDKMLNQSPEIWKDYFFSS